MSDVHAAINGLSTCLSGRIMTYSISPFTDVIWNWSVHTEMILDCYVNQKTLGEFQTKVASQLFKPLDLHCGTVDGGNFCKVLSLLCRKFMLPACTILKLYCTLQVVACDIDRYELGLIFWCKCHYIYSAFTAMTLFSGQQERHRLFPKFLFWNFE